MKQLRNEPVSEYRRFYNDWIRENVGKNTKVLDVGKSQFWEYGFDTIDTNPRLNPTIIGDICDNTIDSGSYDVVLANGMYEFVSDQQKMIDECLRIARKTVIFGFVGKDYKPYKKDWKYYEFKEKLPEHTLMSFNNEYHYLICQKKS